MKRQIILVFIVYLMMEFAPSGARGDCELPMYAPDRDEQIGRYEINPVSCKRFTEAGFLPARTTFLTDEEIARKLDLSLPQLDEVKSAVEQKETARLQQALSDYLYSRLHPGKVPNEGYVPKADEHRKRADPWLGSEITLSIRRTLKKYVIGERIDWYNYDDLEVPDGAAALAWWGRWLGPLTDAYLATGDSKYAQACLTYARSFYKNVRPPINKISAWSGGMGPWSLGGTERIGSVFWLHRAIGDSPLMTVADRVMLLKMVHEHAEQIYIMSETRAVHNFEVGVANMLLETALTFPDFSESKVWWERSIERFTQNIKDTVLEDGGSYERTTYHYAYMNGFTKPIFRLRNAGYPMPESFLRALEPMFDWGMWMLSPLMQYPSLNIGGFDDLTGYMSHALELFPERADFAYVATGGKKGHPPERTARVLPHTGFLTMRSDWTRDAFYMAMNYNGTLPEVGTYPDLLSFGIWAHGRAYMTNAGVPVHYADPLFRDWCTQTKASNTIVVDGESQWPYSNGGRLENWQDITGSQSPGKEDRTGFTYLAGVSDSYRHAGVRHRRAVLFLRPRYWIVHDRMLPIDDSGEPIPKGKVHEYRWQGHFQPTELTLDAETKRMATSVIDGKRLYLIPAHPEVLDLEQGKGVIATGSGSAENPPEGPYISLIQKSDKSAVFTVLLYPTINNARAPVFESIPVKFGKETVQPEDAVGLRLRQGMSEDMIAIAQTSGLRSYGQLETDGETAYIHTEQKKVIEAGLVHGGRISYQGKMILKVSQDIVSVYIRYTDDTVYLDVCGNGKTSISAGSAKEIILNGKSVSAKLSDGQFSIDVPSGDSIKLTTPTFSTDQAEICKAVVGTDYRSGSGEIGGPKKSVLVSWKTSVPSGAVIEYCKEGESTWMRAVNPELTAEHHFVISRLKDGETYLFRITCRTPDGRLGTTRLKYKFE